MPFEICTVERIVYTGPDSYDELLAVTVQGLGIIYIRGTFSDWPLPTSWIVDGKLPIPVMLRTWYDDEVARIKNSLTDETRQYIDSLPYNPFRFLCQEVTIVGERPFVFYVDEGYKSPRFIVAQDSV